ncbi:SPOR domain-containing protein [candidate division KSB1 bacterium]
MKIVLIIIIPLLVFCSGSGKMKQEAVNTGPTEDELANRELFNPNIFPDTFIISKPSFEDYKKVITSEIKAFNIYETYDSALYDSTITAPGFRIQIFMSPLSGVAEEAYMNAITTVMDQPVYKILDAPYFKIRVGNFINREDAEAYMESNLKRQYPNSWIVQTNVSPFASVPKILLDDSLLYADTTTVIVDTSAVF